MKKVNDLNVQMHRADSIEMVRLDYLGGQEAYLEIVGRPDSSQGSNYRTTGRFFHNKLKPVEDPTALSCQTTEIQADFRTISKNSWKTRQL